MTWEQRRAANSIRQTIRDLAMPRYATMLGFPQTGNPGAVRCIWGDWDLIPELTRGWFSATAGPERDDFLKSTLAGGLL